MYFFPFRKDLVGADSEGVLRKGHRGLAFLFCCEVEG